VLLLCDPTFNPRHQATKAVGGAMGHHQVLGVLVALFASATALEHRELASASAGLAAGAGVNPIRRVVTMLQKMMEKVEAEGKIEKELFDKFMCWCETGAAELESAIQAAETKVPQVGSKIEETEALIAQLKAEIAKAKGDRDAALSAIASLKVERKKGHAAFMKGQEDLKTNIAALKKAIAALEKGMTGAFLQTGTAALLRSLVVNSNSLTDSSRDMLSSFLSGGQGEEDGYAPQSGEITGILKQMLDTMESQLKEVTGTETADITNFELMLKAKLKLVDTLTHAIETKLKRLGELMVELEAMKNDLTDTTHCMADDKKFLADMDDICAKKKAEWAIRQKTRSEELAALADTIRILNDDDSLELFKKTLPSASLLQVSVRNAEIRRQAEGALAVSRGRGKARDYRVGLIMMALKGGKVSFDKVIKMVDDMIKLLGEEQTDDDAKKMYCEKQIDKTEDELKELNHEEADLEKAVADTKEMIATLTDEIDALVKGIKELDKQVAEATVTRKEEHEDFVEGLAANHAAKDILAIAKNRLAKFYDPKMYKAPPKRELTEAERITVNNGGTLAPTAAPGGIAGTGVTVLSQVKEHSDDTNSQGPPPETWEGDYQKKDQASSGVMAMIAELEAELDKEIQEATVDEKDAQAEYEEFISDSATKRAEDSKSAEDKAAAKAQGEVDLQKMEEELKATMTEAMTKAESLKDLHMACDWLLSNYGTRKEARTGEVESLKKAKAVLAGADFSLVQTEAKRLRGSF